MSKLKLYKASAGSGKTYTLALEYIRELLARNSAYAHRNILAVTFTNDATGEMKDRILAELYGLAFDLKDSSDFRNSLKDLLKEERITLTDEEIKNRAFKALDIILHDYSRLLVTTIDSFFQKILRNLARELGKGSRFNLEMNTSVVRQNAVNSIVEKAHEDSKLLQWLTTYVQAKLESDGSWRFKNEVYKFSSCIYNEFFQEHESLLRKQLEYDPGVFERLKSEQHRIMQECKKGLKDIYSQVLAILDQNALEPGDFSRGTVINFWRKLAENPNNGITLKKENYLESAEYWVTKSHKRRVEIISLIDTRLMTIFKETLLLYSRYLNAKFIAGNIHQLGLIWYITNEIDALNKENNRFMLSDTAQFLNQMIDDSDAPFIYEKIGSEIRHVMIDEFQDTSRMQWSNFKALLSNILSSNDFSMIVGDVKQSIYRWRSGDWRILDNVSKEYDLQTKNLDFNYRSKKQIVDFNNTVFTEAGLLFDQKMREELPEMKDSPFSRIYAQAEVSQKIHSTEDAGFVSVDFLGGDDDQNYKEQVFSQLLTRLQELHAAGISAEDICILTRKNGEIIAIADFLSRQKNDFPELNAENYLNVVSGEAFELRSSLAVKIIIEAIKVLVNSRDSVHKLQLNHFLNMAHPNDPLCNQEPDIHLSELPLSELISHLYNFYQLDKIEGQSSYLFFLYDAIDRFVKDNPGDLFAFVSYWDEDLSTKTVPIGEGIKGIRAMTIHKSKGLQFNTVLLPYCTWKNDPQMSPVIWCEKKEGVYDLELLPVNFSSKMGETVFSKEYQEEMTLSWLDNLNLLYVAFTRAEHNLIIFGKWKKNLKSIENVKTASDILQWILSCHCGLDPQSPTGVGEFQIKSATTMTDSHFETGRLIAKPMKEKKVSDNPLKQISPAYPVSFRSEAFNGEKPLFKQSNKSREFINPEVKTKDSYVAYGNVMHELFARIRYLSDIEPAADSLVFEGLLLPDEKEECIVKAKNAISAVGVEEWFGDQYKVYSEFSIIIEDKGEITTKRPDRILMSDNATLIVDYKFGEARSSHKKQMQEYIQLLQSMNYPDVQAFLWYVGENRLEKVS
ncbi:UvrD-helicase domain-containing protein [Bacteroidales bacterium OttesenSCG-928-A17]|nr:UvrD-helicase domain-containing protein [Bacteroidales bacterium OttesenSCG-928-A17]